MGKSLDDLGLGDAPLPTNLLEVLEEAASYFEGQLDVEGGTRQERRIADALQAIIRQLKQRRANG